MALRWFMYGVRLTRFIIIVLIGIGIVLIGIGLVYPGLPTSSAAETQSPMGPQSNEAVYLSFHEAIQMALRNNAQTRLATEQRTQARAQFREVLSGILPNFSGIVQQKRQTINLTSIGFSPGILPGVPTLIGPFSSFEARIAVVQTIFDWGIFNNIAAGKTDVRLADLQDNLAREQVANATGVAYIQTLQTKANLKSAMQNLALSRRMLRLSEDQREVGVVDEVALLSAQTQWAQDQASLIAAQTAKVQAVIQLKRIVWVPQDKLLHLTDSMKYEGYQDMYVKQAVEIAESNRPEIKIAKDEVKQSKQLRQAAIGAQLPSIDFSADYGASGSTPTKNVNQTYTLMGQMSIPVFDGGKTIAGINVASSQKRQAEIQLADMRQQVNEDVRIALDQVRNGSAQVKAADAALKYASRQMQLVRDQFATGVADNVQLIQSQNTLAQARDSHVQALAQYQTARINLATALGTMEDFEL